MNLNKTWEQGKLKVLHTFMGQSTGGTLKRRAEIGRDSCVLVEKCDLCLYFKWIFPKLDDSSVFIHVAATIFCSHESYLNSLL